MEIPHGVGEKKAQDLIAMRKFVEKGNKERIPWATLGGARGSDPWEQPVWGSFDPIDRVKGRVTFLPVAVRNSRLPGAIVKFVDSNVYNVLYTVHIPYIYPRFLLHSLTTTA